MSDNYTKTVLTVIAASLVILSIQRVVKPAAAQFGDQCGLQDILYAPTNVRSWG